MRKKEILSLTTAVLILSGCASSKTPSMPPTVPLDRSLAAECKRLPGPPEGDYDALVNWMVEVTGMYGDCAGRHKKTVEAWEEL